MALVLLKMRVALFAVLAAAVLLPNWPEESIVPVAPPVIVNRRSMETDGVWVVW
jgi:hypothetical protein